MFEMDRISLTPKRTRVACSIQTLSSNRLDKDVQRIVFSFNFSFALLLVSKYKLKDNRIYPNGRKYLLFTFFYMLFMNALCVYQLITIDITDDKMNVLEKRVLSSLTVIYSITYLIGFILLFIQNFMHKDKNVLLILKIQSIYSEVDFSSSIRSFVFWNWVSLAGVILLNVFLDVSFYSRYLDWYLNVVLLLVRDFHLIALDVSVVLAIRIIIFIRKLLESWIKDILAMNNEQDNDLYCRRFLIVYLDILKAYNMYEELFQVLIMYNIFGEFYRSFGTAALIISWVRISSKRNYDLYHNILNIIWVTKSVGLVIVHSIQCERFYMTVAEAETACIQLIKNKNCPESQKHLYKGIKQRNRTFRKMTACGLCDIDATLPISFMGALTYYVIVLLQLNFL